MQIKSVTSARGDRFVTLTPSAAGKEKKMCVRGTTESYII